MPQDLENISINAYRDAFDEHSIVAETDLRGAIVYANKKFCEISGYSQKELLGANHRILNSGAQPPSFFKDLWKTIAKGQTWHGEICNRKKGGDLYWVKTTIVPLRNHKGKIHRYMSIRTDITKQVYAEQKLAASNQKLFELTQKLKIERLALNKKNIALHEILNSFETEKKKQLADLKARFDDLFYPVLNQIRAHMPKEKRTYFDILEGILSDLHDDISPNDPGYYNRLSARELQICETLRKGMSVKEIATFYHLSPRTVAKHCENIRRKFGFHDRKQNLATFLRSTT